MLLLLLVSAAVSALPPNHRIIGGEIASPGQFPFIVSLNYPEQFCDGSIINKNWVLTAAHCIDDSKPGSTVLAGTIYQNSGGTKYNISKMIKHENYSSSTTENDIGLIQIEGEFEFSEMVQPVEFADPEINATCSASGWGGTEVSSYPEELRYVELIALSLEDCRDLVGGMDPFYLGPEQICGLGPEGKGVCFGDSGGPLACGGKLAGIVSYAVSACAKGYPDVYTRPSAYVDWINENAQ